jgi:hypothetical protein
MLLEGPEFVGSAGKTLKWHNTAEGRVGQIGLDQPTVVLVLKGRKISCSGRASQFEHETEGVKYDSHAD